MTIIEPIIQHADWFFPGELDFNVSGAFVPAVPAAFSNNVSYTTNDITYEFGPLEKKRPISMIADGEFLKKESSGMKTLEFHMNNRRGGTLSRKHAAPAFQPPLPPSEGGTHTDPSAPTIDGLTGGTVLQSTASIDPLTNHGNDEARYSQMIQ
ncbi:hypothetical protein GDO86_004170 [Hymenochirus boettgeri]|uniref:Uncharacterized protein n=1 Tax=Hymenochirus boettgeri TaxID=247094 RepID=A0A8T2K7T8_9PIPI|nr:hypothetical protein GDO86_004170 [Hymenochirus boettgeri]